jgi:hypothetical protein
MYEDGTIIEVPRPSEGKAVVLKHHDIKMYGEVEVTLQVILALLRVELETLAALSSVRAGEHTNHCPRTGIESWLSISKAVT